MSEHPDLDLDAAVSADLDGDLAGFATEAGLDEATVRRLLTTPEARERRERIAAARAALQRPPEPLDDLARRRVLTAAAAGAGSAAPGRGAARWPTRLAAAAAAVVLLVGGGIFLATRSGDDNAAKSSRSAATAGRIPKGDLGNLGALDQSKVDRLIRGLDAGDKTQTSLAPDVRPSSALDSADNRDATGPATTAKQVASCRSHYEASGTVRFTAAGSFGGTPAVIVGIANGDRTIVFVVAASDCTTVLYSASSTG